MGQCSKQIAAFVYAPGSNCTQRTTDWLAGRQAATCLYKKTTKPFASQQPSSTDREELISPWLERNTQKERVNLNH